MKDKYWAMKKYGEVDPGQYEKARFRTNAGKLIDKIEKGTVLGLLIKYQKYYHKRLTILDCACGPGRLAFFLEKNLTNVAITGIDINKNMVDAAKETGLEQNSRVKFMTADFYHLPFNNNQFDVIAGLRFSMHIPDINLVLKELSRILKVGGVLIFDIFNQQSILRFNSTSEKVKKQPGFYSCQDIIRDAYNYKLEFLGRRGIFLFGETIVRCFPDKRFFFLSLLNTPPFFLQNFSTKIVLCFRKN